MFCLSLLRDSPPGRADLSHVTSTSPLLDLLPLSNIEITARWDFKCYHLLCKMGVAFYPISLWTCKHFLTLQNPWTSRHYSSPRRGSLLLAFQASSVFVFYF